MSPLSAGLCLRRPYRLWLAFDQLPKGLQKRTRVVYFKHLLPDWGTHMQHTTSVRSYLRQDQGALHFFWILLMVLHGWAGRRLRA